MATYDGVNIFGSAVRIQHVPRPRAAQTAAYFGVSGTQILDGGSRGRVFHIRGVLTGATIADLDAAEETFYACADGVARTLIDNRGRSWPNVVFKGEFLADPRGVVAGGGGWALPYRAVFYGLS